MSQRRVADVMTTDVITVTDDASLTEIAGLLTERGVSAVPVVDRFDVVVGVVSWTDLHRAMEVWRPDDLVRRRRRRRRRQPQSWWSGGTAVEVMSAPPVTIRYDTSLTTAGRLMRQRTVGRLVVVDHKRRLAGIITQGDLLKVHDRLDTVIHDEVRRILRRTLTIEPVTVQATVVDGVVTLAGRTDRKTTALAAAGLAEAVPGVTAVVNELVFDTDDTAATAVTPPVRDPMCDWWTAAAITATPPRAVAAVGHARENHAGGYLADGRQRGGSAPYRKTRREPPPSCS